MAQTVDDVEIVVVDDASPSPVAVPDHPRVRLVRSETNGGVGPARNLGVAHARGEYVAFLDDDDIWVPRRLEFALAALHRAPLAVCWQSPRQGRILEGNVFDVILDDTTPSLGATALLRSAWLPFDGTYRSCEDLVWWLATSRGNRVATHPEQGLRVRAHQGPRNRSGAQQRIVDSLRLMDEHRDYFLSHPRAAAFRWKRIGLMNASLGRQREARRAFVHSLRARPNVHDLGHLLMTLR